MSDLRGRAYQETVPRRSDGGMIDLRTTRDGSVIVLPWVQACVMEGLGFSVGYGSAANIATTVGTFGAGGVDLTEHDLLQTLPANGSTAVIPIFFKPVFEVIGTIAAVDVLLVFGSGGIIAAGSTATPVNLKPDDANTSACTIGILGDAGGTAIAVSTYIYREGSTALTGEAGDAQTMLPEWSIGKAGYAPVVSGASRQVAGFASAQAATGYITYHWLEMSSSYF